MGMSVFILSEEQSYIPIDKLILDLNGVCTRLGFALSSGIKVFDDNDKLKHYSVGISSPDHYQNDEQNNISVDIYDEPFDYQYRDFNWTDDNKIFFNVLIINEIYKNERIVLNLLHEYFKLNPQLIAWIEEDWFYTLYDLEKIINRPYDENWCYKNPNEE